VELWTSVKIIGDQKSLFIGIPLYLFSISLGSSRLSLIPNDRAILSTGLRGANALKETKENSVGLDYSLVSLFLFI